MGFLGAAVGAAATGLKPVVEMMFIEFIGVALDQLTTEATRMRYLSRGQVTVPLVVRASAGAGLGFGCQHSQMLDYWFRGVGGLKVCVVSNAQNAYGLLRAAIHDPDPVVVLEPRVLYGERQELITGEEGIVPLGEARIVSPGDDVTIVTAGAMVGVAEQAAIADDRHVVRGDRPADARALGQADGRRLGGQDRTSGRRRGGSVDGAAGATTSPPTCPPSCSARCRLRCCGSPARTSLCRTATELERRFLPSPEYVAEQTTQLIETGRPPAPWWAREEKS